MLSPGYHGAIDRVVSDKSMTDQVSPVNSFGSAYQNRI
jgi:hypothetical protein